MLSEHRLGIVQMLFLLMYLGKRSFLHPVTEVAAKRRSADGHMEVMWLLPLTGASLTSFDHSARGSITGILLLGTSYKQWKILFPQFPDRACALCLPCAS